MLERCDFVLKTALHTVKISKSLGTGVDLLLDRLELAFPCCECSLN